MEPAHLSLFLRAIQRRLVNAGTCYLLASSATLLTGIVVEGRLTIRKVRLEQVIISPRNLLHRLRKLQSLLGRKLHQRAHVSLRNNEHLKRPDSPPRADGQERIVLPNHALSLLHLHLDVVPQQVPPLVLPVVLGHLHQLLAGFLGQRARRPDLAVRVGVRAAHGRALVLEDLHVPQLLFRGGDLAVRVGWDLGECARCGGMERV